MARKKCIRFYRKSFENLDQSSGNESLTYKSVLKNLMYTMHLHIPKSEIVHILFSNPHWFTISMAGRSFLWKNSSYGKENLSEFNSQCAVSNVFNTFAELVLRVSLKTLGNLRTSIFII